MPYYRKSKGKQYLYFLTERPVDFGTCPKGFIEYENYDTKKSELVPRRIDGCIKMKRIEAYAHVYYPQKLSQEDVEKYELTYGGCE